MRNECIDQGENEGEPDNDGNTLGNARGHLPTREGDPGDESTKTVSEKGLGNSGGHLTEEEGVPVAKGGHDGDEGSGSNREHATTVVKGISFGYEGHEDSRIAGNDHENPKSSKRDYADPKTSERDPEHPKILVKGREQQGIQGAKPKYNTDHFPRIDETLMKRNDLRFGTSGKCADKEKPPTSSSSSHSAVRRGAGKKLKEAVQVFKAMVARFLKRVSGR